MQCPICNYFMGDLDTECARCQGKGLQQPVAPTTPSTSASQPINNAISVAANNGLNGLQAGGAILLAIGVLCTAYFFFFFDPSVGDPSLSFRVNNFGLMAQRQNGILIGLGLMIVGAILFGIGYSQSGSITGPISLGASHNNTGATSYTDIVMLSLFSVILPLGGIVFCLINLQNQRRLCAAAIGTGIGALIWFYTYYRMYIVT